MRVAASLAVHQLAVAGYAGDAGAGIVLSAFPVFADYSARASKLFLLSNLVPDLPARLFSVYMRQFADNAGWLTAGLALLAATALSLMLTIERTF